MKKLLCVLGVLLLGSGTASAQDTSTISLGIRQIQQRILLRHSLARAAMRREIARGGQPSGGGGTTTTTARRPRSTGTTVPKSTGTTAPKPAGTTTFSPVAPMLVPQELASQLGKTPDERAKLERMFSQLLENYRSNLRRNNAPPNDVARAASYLIASSYMVYNNTEPLSDAQYKALREQMHDTFTADAKFQSLSNRERQELFEGYGITGAWIDVGYNLVRQNNDGQAMAQWREMARKNLESMLGAQPEQLSFTDQGVEIR